MGYGDKKTKTVYIDTNNDIDGRFSDLSYRLSQIITINVKDYGAKGDGVSDDTEAIKEAINTLPQNGGRLIFPPGVYLHGVTNKKPSGYEQSGEHNGYPKHVPIDGVAYPYYVKDGKNIPIGSTTIGEDIRFIFDGKNNIEVLGYGAVIKSHPDNSCILRNGGFVFYRCQNITIRGLEYDGSIPEREPFMLDSGGYNFQHGFAIADDCENFYLENVKANRTVMDGFNIHRRCRNVTLKDCQGFENYRQGVTVGDIEKLVIEGGEFSRTGTIFGTAPMDGIDIEVWEETPTRHHVYKGITFKDNLGNGLSLQKGTHEATVENCVFVRNRLRIDQRSTKNNTVRNNAFFNTRLVSYSKGTYVDDNIFYFDEAYGAMPSTYELSIQYEELGSIVARGGRIQGNSVYVSPDIAGMDMVGGVKLTEGIDFTGNTLRNVYSALVTPIVSTAARVFRENTIIYDGTLTAPGEVMGGEINHSNIIDSIYTNHANYPYNETRM